MIRLSSGLLDAARELLVIVDRYGSVSEALHKELRQIMVVDTSRVVDLALQCGWLGANISGQLVLSPRGRDLRQEGESELARRIQLRDVLQAERPTWVALTWRGRAEVLPMI
jgi:hypothetical protein